MTKAPVRSFMILLLLGIVLITIALVVRSGLLLSKNPGLPINSAMRYALSLQAPQLSTEDSLFIDKHFSTAYITPDGLRYITHDLGTGKYEAKAGDELVVNYTGQLFNGLVFDSTDKKGPFTFTLGSGAVIKGWDEGMVGMKKGEKKLLIIPYWLAFGTEGKPPSIPTKATLIFEVEVLDIHPAK